MRMLWLKATFVLPWAAGAHGFVQAAVLGVIIAGGIAIYGLLLVLFGVIGWGEAVRAIRHNPVRDLRD